MARALKQAGSTPKEGGQYVNVLFVLFCFFLTDDKTTDDKMTDGNTESTTDDKTTDDRTDDQRDE